MLGSDWGPLALLREMATVSLDWATLQLLDRAPVLLVVCLMATPHLLDQ